MKLPYERRKIVHKKRVFTYFWGLPKVGHSEALEKEKNIFLSFYCLIMATQRNQVYKCSVCGNMTEVIHTSIGTLVCCGKDMELMSDEIKSEGEEKHIPVIEIDGNRITIKVGSVSHPMTPEHYIERIEIITKNRTYKKFLNPDPTRPDQPITIFDIDAEIISARAYCNIHGLRKIDI